VKEKRINEIKGVVLIAAGLIIMASLLSFTPFDLKFYTSSPNVPAHNLIKTFGAYFAGLLFFLFGKSSYLIPGLILYIGFRMFKQDKPDLRIPRFFGFTVLLLSASSLIGTFTVSN